MVILQKTNSFLTHPNATVMENTDDGEGWGSGSSSSINHKGESDQVDIENGSATYFLVQTGEEPSVGDDLDADDDGVPDAEFFLTWNIFDSVGVLDNDGLGDIGYGAIHFRRNSAAQATNTVVEVHFTPDYVARRGNSTGHEPEDWVCGGSLDGEAPNFMLGEGNDTEPPTMSGELLNHVGGPNFGAAEMPGIVVRESDFRTVISEEGGNDTYSVALNTMPVGPVEIEISSPSQMRLVLQGNEERMRTNVVILTNTMPVTIEAEAEDDIWVEASPHVALVSHRVLATADPVQYPTNAVIPDVEVEILENDRVLLSELKVNPPGEDIPYEFIEIKGVPGAVLTNVLVVALEGDFGNDPGTANIVIDLTSYQIGGNGLLFIGATTNPYPLAPETTFVPAPQLDEADGGFSNGSVSFLLLSTKDMIDEGEDLDAGDNGKAEDLPKDMYLMDAVGWRDGDTNDFVYGGVDLVLASGTPDAATRFPGDDRPLTAEAWYFGNLLGEDPSSLTYDPTRSSTNFPSGSALSPGLFNNTAPAISLPWAFSGVIDDPTNPALRFSVSDNELLPEAIVVSVTTDNPEVVPQENLTLTNLEPGEYVLSIEPVGVGYSTVTVRADDGDMTGFVAIDYAASRAGLVTSRFHVGAADASTAISIPPDLMLVADDENQTIRLFARHFSGAALNGFDMNPFLNLTDFENNRPREVDMEGATRVGDRIYWMGSHSHANIGEIRTNRARMFATDVSGTGTNTSLAYVGHYEHLKADLVAWDESNAHGKGAGYYGLAIGAADGLLPKDPFGRGFNIEGLAMAPGRTNTAWLGFRAPIVPATNRLFALIVPVTNFHEVSIGGGGPGLARFGEPIELDFQGRGIRSIEGDTNGYLIITGPPGDIPTPFPPGDFKMYTWTGNSEDRPQQLAADLLDLNPEAIVELPPHPWDESSRFQIISDNGRMVYYNDGIAGKFLPESAHKKFRSDIITFGPVVKPRPFITDVEMSQIQLALSWRSNPGDAYRVQTAADFTEPWDDVSGDIMATEVITSATFTNAVELQRFYRVVLLP